MSDNFDIKHFKRPAYLFKDKEGNTYVVSVQASRFHYSTPRTWLENIDDYEAVEVGFFKNEEPLNSPGAWGILGFEKFWQGDTVAAFMPLKKAKALLEEMTRRFGPATKNTLL